MYACVYLYTHVFILQKKTFYRIRVLKFCSQVNFFLLFYRILKKSILKFHFQIVADKKILAKIDLFFGEFKGNFSDTIKPDFGFHGQ